MRGTTKSDSQHRNLNADVKKLAHISAGDSRVRRAVIVSEARGGCIDLSKLSVPLNRFRFEQEPSR